MKNKLLLVFLLFICSKDIFADTFMVVSNADSGAGTLREALVLTTANGNSIPDSIIFNIADVSEAGRTIKVLTQLPNLSSNLIIDASSQPGNTFGVSNAKIKIQHAGTLTFGQAFILADVSDIAIYSIYFSDFKYGDLIETRCAIFTAGIVKNIKIGAAGKGNVFFGNSIAIANNYGAGDTPPQDLFSDVEIKSNFFGLNEDGETMDPGRQIAIAVRSFKNILIGGNTVEEGNFFIGGFNGGTDAVVYMTTSFKTDNGFVKLVNNSFGSNYPKTIALKCGFVKIQGEQSYNNNYSNAVVTISNNMFNNALIGFTNFCNGMLFLNDINGYIRITGNKIGNLVDYFFSCQTIGIGINNCVNGIIGGDSPEEQNIIGANFTCGVALSNDSNFIIRKNSFLCNGKGIQASSTKVTIPYVKILATNEVDKVSGKATPNCNIEVFQNKKNCSVCENGELYLGETSSDNMGNWSFTTPFFGAMTARATTADSISGEFSEARFDESSVTVSQPVCNMNNGAITGMKFISGSKYYWVHYSLGQFDTIFNQLDLFNLEPGSYEFYVEQTNYCKKKYSAYLYDNSPKINTQNQEIINPSCGIGNGSILYTGASGNYSKIYWLSFNRDTVERKLDLLNKLEGQYKMFVVNEQYGCKDSTNWITLTNQSGPSVNINNIQIKNANCGNANGSVTGITVTNSTGSEFIEWSDSVNTIVGNNIDLENIKAGKYKLRFKDQSGCDTISSSFTVFDTSVITIDQSNSIIIPSRCLISSGSISKIQVTNATTYIWRNTNDNSFVGNALDIDQLATGTYQLTATNAFGCSAISTTIVISISNFNPIGVVNYTLKDASCNNADGKITIINFSKDASFYTFRWIDSSSNLQLATGTEIKDLGKGVFIMLAKDSNGCEEKIFSALVDSLPTIKLNTANLKVTNDVCSKNKGSITDLRIDDLRGIGIYKWYNDSSRVVGTTLNLNNIAAGQYYLDVEDAYNCFLVTSRFIIIDDLNAGTNPQYNNLLVTKNAPATFSVNNFEAGTYFLYGDAAGTQLLQQNTTGTFTTSNINANTIFYIKHKAGNCNSQLVQIKIAVVEKSFFAIPAAFTPNNDNLNDRLTVKVIWDIKLNYFKLYNRFGQLVFETRQINSTWDGKFNGSKSPVGGYVWMAEGIDLTGNVINDSGTILLLR